MLTHSLLVAHIVVLGYWLGSELVINSTYRYVSYHGEMPFADRDRLMTHVLNVDQHVRYALVLQVGLGVTLAALLGYIPGGTTTATVAALVAFVWLVFVEVVHRQRQSLSGPRLAAVDRGIRYVLLAALVGVWALALFGSWPLERWLAWKLLFFAGVIACGVGIRIQIIAFYKVWGEIEQQGASTARERLIQQIYVRATSILVGLWVFIAGITLVSVFKPG